MQLRGVSRKNEIPVVNCECKMKVYFQTATRLSFLFVVSLCLSFGRLSAQAPILTPVKKSPNNIARIDSLTQALYTKIPSHITPNLILDEGFNKSQFKEAMEMLGSSIHFEYHKLVEEQIRYFSKIHPSFYDRLHERMSLYFPVFEEILDKKGLPTELKYVSVIESSLNPNAVSWAGATGLWQFMPYTGKHMGMTINHSLDERKSILASTEKACEYFSNSMAIFDDWLLSIASYNCGAGNVQRAIRRAGGNKKTFWEILPFLPKETRYYVPKFIAMAYVLNFTEHANRPKYNKQTQFLVPTRVDSSLHLAKMCTFLAGDQKSDLLSLNCEFIKPNTGNATNNTILLPYSYSMCFISENDSLTSYAALSLAELKSQSYGNSSSNRYGTRSTKRSGNSRVHIVKRGETLSHLSHRYGVSVKSIMQANGMRNSRIRVGQRLVIGGYKHTKNHP